MRYSYFVIKRTCILLVEMLIILLAYIGSLVNLPVLLLVIVGTAYSILRLGCMIADKINRPVRKRLEYRRMTTGRIWNRWDSSKGKELKKYVDYMIDILGLVSDELKEDIIVVCLLICAIDGHISLKEKNWIKQLIK